MEVLLVTVSNSDPALFKRSKYVSFPFTDPGRGRNLLPHDNLHTNHRTKPDEQWPCSMRGVQMKSVIQISLIIFTDKYLQNWTPSGQHDGRMAPKRFHASNGILCSLD